MLKLLLPLYGLADSGDYWNTPFRKHFADNLDVKKVASDMSLFFKHARGRASRLLASHVDDSIASGDNKILEFTEKSGQLFEVKGRETDKKRFIHWE